MNKLEKTVKELKIEINKNPIVLEYFNTKEKVENNGDLQRIYAQMSDIRKKMKDDIKLKKEFILLKKEYDENPLVINYQNARNELLDFIEEIKGSIE